MGDGDVVYRGIGVFERLVSHSFPPTTVISIAAPMIFLPTSTTIHIFFVAFFIPLIQGQDFRPAVVPLSVKSPYLNAWIEVPASEEPQTLLTWPRLWTWEHVSAAFRVILD
jgi:hypothetical protein